MVEYMLYVIISLSILLIIESTGAVWLLNENKKYREEKERSEDTWRHTH